MRMWGEPRVCANDAPGCAHLPRKLRTSHVRTQDPGKIIEQGEIAFLYRPRVGEHDTHDLEDLQRTHLLLHPDQENVYRLITIGRKRLPEHEGGEAERNWAYVDLVRKDAESIEKELREQR